MSILYSASSRFRTWSTSRLLHTPALRGGLPSHYILPSGDKIPSVALGVWKASKGEVGEAVKTALKAGYRHIDDAWIYKNEEQVGAAIKESGIPRKDIWITSKLWNDKHNPEDVAPALEDSLRKLGLDYLDLYLIHWPVAFKRNPKPDGSPDVDFKLTEDIYSTWQAMEELVDTGKVRNIGISNFNIRRIQNLTANRLKYPPAVNQVELSFWNPQPELVSWAAENNLLLEAYSPLGSSDHVKESLRVPEVKAAANELSMTPAQVIISWHVQRGTVVLPKSVTPSRVVENFGIAKLPTSHFDAIERAASSHPPKRAVNPNWGGIDVFEDDK